MIDRLVSADRKHAVVAALRAEPQTRAMRWRMPARATNLQLFVALALAFATGAAAMATGSVHGRWIVIAHGVVGLVVVALIPWKTGWSGPASSGTGSPGTRP